jgi:hypothetical protein
VSLKVRLLIDCRTAFRDADGLPTETLITRLRDDLEAPWDTLGKLGLRPRSLGSMLHEFGISSATHRWPDGAQTKGYRRDQFIDAWNRYCPQPGPGHLSVPSETAVCISCRQPLSHDDGTHTHPTCTTA